MRHYLPEVKANGSGNSLGLDEIHDLANVGLDMGRRIPIKEKE